MSSMHVQGDLEDRMIALGNKSTPPKYQTLKIIEDYFRDKPLWHELSETEAKELFALLNPTESEEERK